MKSSKQIRKEQRELFEAEKKRKKVEKHRVHVLANVNSKFKCLHCGESIGYHSLDGQLRIFHQILTDNPKAHFLSLK